jgi:hypothetical protein
MPQGAMALTCTATRGPTTPPLFLQAPNPYRCLPAYADEQGWLVSRKGVAPGEDPLPVKLGFYRPREWGPPPYIPVSTCAFGVHMRRECISPSTACPSMCLSACHKRSIFCSHDIGTLPPLLRP